MSEEAILKWYSDAHLSRGKSVFLEQMKKFVEWLKNAEEGKNKTFFRTCRELALVWICLGLVWRLWSGSPGPGCSWFDAVILVLSAESESEEEETD